MRYRKKPSEVEAIQWSGTNSRAVSEFMGERFEVVDNGKPATYAQFFCAKSNAYVVIYPSDWIICEQDGTGFYPCKADVFAATYDPVSLDIDPNASTP